MNDYHCQWDEADFPPYVSSVTVASPPLSNEIVVK